MGKKTTSLKRLGSGGRHRQYNLSGKFKDASAGFLVLRRWAGRWVKFVQYGNPNGPAGKLAGLPHEYGICSKTLTFATEPDSRGHLEKASLNASERYLYPEAAFSVVKCRWDVEVHGMQLDKFVLRPPVDLCRDSLLFT